MADILSVINIEQLNNAVNNAVSILSPPAPLTPVGTACDLPIQTPDATIKQAGPLVKLSVCTKHSEASQIQEDTGSRGMGTIHMWTVIPDNCKQVGEGLPKIQCTVVSQGSVFPSRNIAKPVELIPSHHGLIQTNTVTQSGLTYQPPSVTANLSETFAALQSGTQAQLCTVLPRSEVTVDQNDSNLNQGNNCLLGRLLVSCVKDPVTSDKLPTSVSHGGTIYGTHRTPVYTTATGFASETSETVGRSNSTLLEYPLVVQQAETGQQVAMPPADHQANHVNPTPSCVIGIGGNLHGALTPQSSSVCLRDHSLQPDKLPDLNARGNPEIAGMLAGDASGNSANNMLIITSLLPPGGYDVPASGALDVLIDDGRQKETPASESENPPHVTMIEFLLKHQDPSGVCPDGEDDLGDVVATDQEPVMDHFIPGVYCVECNDNYQWGCPQHDTTYHQISDSPILSRARATTPKQLYLSDPMSETRSTVVHCKEFLPAKMKLGPLVGKLTNKDAVEGLEDTAYLWQLFVAGSPSDVLDCRSEDESNWMMFVRRASSDSGQNLVAYQTGAEIFFITTRKIQPSEELLYWYAKDYALLLDMPLHPEGVFRCTQCQKQYPTRKALSGHHRLGHPDQAGRRHQCDVCHKAFRTQAKLSTHAMTHKGIKPYACPYCQKKFTEKSNLNKHVKIHLGEKNYVCTICDKKCRQKIHLETHMLVHTGEKKLRCNYCDKTFSRQVSLRMHQYQHTRERVFTCQLCQKDFFSKQTLEKHSRTHTGERTQKCPKCERLFMEKYNLTRHSKTCKGARVVVGGINIETGAELGLSIAKRRIQKRDSEMNAVQES